MTLGHQAALRLSPSGSCAELYCLASRPAPGLSAWAQLRSLRRGRRRQLGRSRRPSRRH